MKGMIDLQNPNASAAALTAVFVWVLDRLLRHFGVADMSPAQVLVVAGGATYVVLWIGRDGLLGAARRLWFGAKAVAGVKPGPPA